MTAKRPVVVPPMDTTPEALAKMVLRHRPKPPDTRLAGDPPAEAAPKPKRPAPKPGTKYQPRS